MNKHDLALQLKDRLLKNFLICNDIKIRNHYVDTTLNCTDDKIIETFSEWHMSKEDLDKIVNKSNNMDEFLHLVGWL